MTIVKFAQIDCKDDADTGYYPIGFVAENAERKTTVLSANAQCLIVFASLEYLQRVYALQQELAAKYEAMLKSGDVKKGTRDEFYAACIDDLDVNMAWDKEAKAVFPGPYAESYD